RARRQFAKGVGIAGHRLVAGCGRAPEPRSRRRLLQRPGNRARVLLVLALIATALGAPSSAERAGAASSAAAPAQQAGGGTLTAGSSAQVSGPSGDGLHVRATPGDEGDVRATLPDGPQVQIVD